MIVDPAYLDDSLDIYTEEKIEQYGGLPRMINRNDDTVSAVLVAGHAVFLNGQPTEVLGTQRTGSFLHRDFFDAEIVACPDPSLIGKSFADHGVEAHRDVPFLGTWLSVDPRMRQRHRRSLDSC